MSGLGEALFIEPMLLLVVGAVVLGIIALFFVYNMRCVLSEVERIVFCKGVRSKRKLDAVKELFR